MCGRLQDCSVVALALVWPYIYAPLDHRMLSAVLVILIPFLFWSFLPEVCWHYTLLVM
jgi:hypothetical protein